MKISGSIITYNEEAKLEDCLESMNFCDEIVIIDSNSTDGTKKIAEKFAKKYSGKIASAGAANTKKRKTQKDKNRIPGNKIIVKFISKKFIGYGPQKNYATKKCKHDWILSLDADERVSEELKKSILNLKAEVTEVTNLKSTKSIKIAQTNKNEAQNPNSHNNPNNADNPRERKDINSLPAAYTVNRLNQYVGSWIHHCGWYPDRRIRFFNKKQGSWSDVQVHELYETKGTVSHIKGDLLHLSIDSISDHLSNIDRFTTLAAKQSFEKGKKAGIIRIIFQTIFTFIKMYLLKRGFLDGKAGFILSVMSAYYSFIKYTKLYYLNRK